MPLRHLLPLLLAAAFAGRMLPAAAQTPEAEPAAAPTRLETPLRAMPYTPSIDVSTIDHSADACVDFYQYACGGWLTANPIPADQSRWGVYGKLGDDTQRFLWGILEELSQRDGGKSDGQQKIGDLYAACMDEAAIERRGLEPLQPALAAIDALRSKRELPALLARMHLATADDGFFFGFGSGQDLANSARVIAFARGGGLTLPDRDYYLKRDTASQTIRRRYREHVQGMFELLGETSGAAGQAGDAVIAIETALARATLSRVAQRDPYRLFHVLDERRLQGLTPAFDWPAYLGALGAPPLARINVTEPAYFRALQREWQTRSLGALKNYLRWHLLHARAPLLPQTFVQADHAFFNQVLLGVPQMRPRWRRCVALVDEQLGDALGREYVERAFTPAMKEATQRMTRQIEAAMERELAQLDWMSEATRRSALDKLHAMVNKIGYPERWRDFGALAIARDDLLGDVERSTRFESQRQLAKIGQPLDRGEWSMTPPTVNAYYDAQMNDMNFPAAVLQPPLFDLMMDDAPNYGSTGATIGHELTHGFDDEGRQYDARGNLRNWWTPQDAAAFDSRTRCVVDQFAQFTIVDDIKINGRLTEGENVADLGGLVLAWSAWKAQTAGQSLQPRDGLTPEQRFFVGFAQSACEAARPEQLRVAALSDLHAPMKFRANGPLANMPEFGQAFSCRPGQPMAPLKRCRVW